MFLISLQITGKNPGYDSTVLRSRE